MCQRVIVTYIKYAKTKRKSMQILSQTFIAYQLNGKKKLIKETKTTIVATNVSRNIGMAKPCVQLINHDYKSVCFT